ncbi:NmrA family NAD(P)-binding protein [Microbulbifer halophilus]|uniref:NmrA family NAD(P)-binding protein n=1 Tax=Microbulbifer halophilus TaxID=453963 RepID=A0ABW5ECL2_9GAMM|nr:NmrA family NAD(P)-binding protein [Microbulbifer halophilus]MCW8126571.1 NmrA family NAD(P)-binding protein [Microbulbifer halophilus]
MSREKKLIAVVGATGQQGAGVVTALKASGTFRVRALTRAPEHYRGPADEVVYADLDTPDTLVSAFRDAYGVFAVTNAWQPGTDEAAQCRAAIRAARGAGVTHFIWSTLPDVAGISANRFDVPHFSNKAAMDREVTAAGFKFHTFVMPGFYYQNFIQALTPTSQADGTRGWALPLDPAVEIEMADIADLGKLVAGAFHQPEKADDGIYLPLVGDRLSFNQIIEILRKQGHSLTFTRVPAKDFEEGFPGARELAQMMAWFEAYGYLGGNYRQQIKLAETIAGSSPGKFASWAQAHIPLDREG